MTVRALFCGYRGTDLRFLLRLGRVLAPVVISRLLSLGVLVPTNFEELFDAELEDELVDCLGDRLPPPREFVIRGRSVSECACAFAIQPQNAFENRLT